MFCFSLIKLGWNSHRCLGSFRLATPGQTRLPSWRTHVDKYVSHHPVAVSDVPVYQKRSTYVDAGDGMFASRFLQKGEVVVEYTGSWKTMSRDEFDKLVELHEDDGNGVVELPRGQTWTATQAPGAVTCLDPYISTDGTVRESGQVPGIWANHRCHGDVGCNLVLKASRYLT
jgi:hypothetical protein